MNMELLIAIVRRFRTQQRCSAAAGVQPYRLSRIINGWVQPSEEERARIARALGEPEAALFGDVDALTVENPKPSGAHVTA